MHNILIDPPRIAYLKIHHQELRTFHDRPKYWPSLRGALLTRDEARAMPLLDSWYLSSCAQETLWMAATLRLENVFAYVAKDHHPAMWGSLHLCMACLSGDEYAVGLLAPFTKGSGWDDPLVCAARSGNAALVQSILPHCDARAHGSQALVEACGVGSLEVVQHLLPHSSQIAAAARALPLAAARGEVGIVAEILASPLPDRQTACYRAWEYAVKYRQTACIEMLNEYAKVLPHTGLAALRPST
ncbi:ankyrin repeat protein [Stenotrophomonas rhizophila]|uniref:Ankyrin repeat protein n=1 Tax=Stenotrophomonas rhizophila TaxID=216778 RepID=A0A498CEX1_9GAMM|nr:ankyrin repeat domain-containing protein [Stenotrophomonas rhizophila]RLK56376.1 ankyrin repeat protein [Stenotrophomonas rhizophila]